KRSSRCRSERVPRAWVVARLRMCRRTVLAWGAGMGFSSVRGVGRLLYPHKCRVAAGVGQISCASLTNLRRVLSIGQGFSRFKVDTFQVALSLVEKTDGRSLTPSVAGLTQIFQVSSSRT